MSFGRSERLVGRERELMPLREWLGQVSGGSSGVYVIAGEPRGGTSHADSPSGSSMRNASASSYGSVLSQLRGLRP